MCRDQRELLVWSILLVGAFLDTDMQDYNGGGSKSVFGKLKIMVARTAELQRVEPPRHRSNDTLVSRARLDGMQHGAHGGYGCQGGHCGY